MRRPAALPRAFPTCITIYELDQSGNKVHSEGRSVLEARPMVVVVRGEPALGARLTFWLASGSSVEWPGRLEISPRSLRALHHRLDLQRAAERQMSLF